MRSYIPKIILAVFLLALLGLGVFTYEVYRTHPPTQKTKTAAADGRPEKNSNTSDQTAQNQSDQNTQPAAASNADNAPAASIAQEEANNNSASGGTGSTTQNSGGSDSAATTPVSLDNRNAGSGQMLAHITTAQCTAGCKAYANNLSLLEYCQEVCGLIPVKSVTNCDGQSGIDKDYCEKDLAVTKNDPSICNQISDVNIKQTCQNRIAQDMIESQ